MTDSKTTETALSQCPLCFEYTAHIAILECCLSPVCANCYHDVHTNGYCCLHLYKVELTSLSSPLVPVTPTSAELAKSKAAVTAKLAQLQTIRRKTIKFYNTVSQVVDIKLPQPLQYYQQADLKNIDQAIELISTIQANQETFSCLTAALPEFTLSYSINYITFDDAREMVRLPPVWPQSIYAVISKLFHQDDLTKLYTLLLAISKRRGHRVVLTGCTGAGSVFLNLLALIRPFEHTRAGQDILFKPCYDHSVKKAKPIVLIELGSTVMSGRGLSQLLTGNALMENRVIVINHAKQDRSAGLNIRHPPEVFIWSDYDGPEAIRFKSDLNGDDIKALTRDDFIKDFASYLEGLRLI